MTNDEARAFADEWYAAWNSHDLEAILAHYDEVLVFSSPNIKALGASPDGVLTGRDKVAAYWRKALDLRPDLAFTPEHVLVGIDSVTLTYTSSVGRRAAEVFFFGPDGKVVRSAAHYADLK